MCPVGLFFFAQPLDFVLPEHVLQGHAIQIVEVGPRNLALPYFLHRGTYPSRQLSVTSAQLIFRPLALPQLVASAITEPRQSTTVPNVSKTHAFTLANSGFTEPPVACWARTAGSAGNDIAIPLAPAATKNSRRSSLNPIQ